MTMEPSSLMMDGSEAKGLLRDITMAAIPARPRAKIILFWSWVSAFKSNISLHQ